MQIDNSIFLIAYFLLAGAWMADILIDIIKPLKNSEYLKILLNI